MERIGRADDLAVPSGGGASPPRRNRSLPGRYGVFVVAAAALAFALVLARGATWGPGLDIKSVDYLRVADNLLDGEGFTRGHSPRGVTPYVSWPPLYPLLLAAARLLGLDPLSGIHLPGAALFALTVFVVGRYAGRHLRSRFLRLWTPVAAALSLPFAEWAWRGVSEPPFALFTLLALVLLGRFLEEGKRACLAWSAVFAGLAFSTRYFGVVLLAFTGAILLLRRGARGREKLRNAAAYAAIAGLPNAVWFVRNYFVSGTLTARHGAPDYDAAEILGDIGSAVLAWARFDGSSAALLALGALLPPAALLLRRRTGATRGAPLSPPAATQAGRRRWMLLFGGFGLAYIGLYFTALMLGQSLDGVEPRHLFPARLPLVLALATALDPLLEAGRGRRLFERVGAVAAAALLSAWTVGQIGPQRRAVLRANSAEVLFANGYLGEPWASSETLRFARADSYGESRRVYTNLWAPVLAHLGGRPDLRAIRGVWVGGEAPGDDLPQERLAAFLEGVPEGARLVWSTDFLRPRYRAGPPAVLFATPGLRPLAEFADGAVFAVDRGYAPPRHRYREAYEFLRTKEPDAEADFELYLDRGSASAAKGPRLFYRRDSCREESLREGRFFLHVYPEAPGVLPAERAPHRFENLDFDFFRWGVLFELEGGGRACLATVPLPDYGIARVRTGRYRSGDGEIWSAEIRPE